MQLKIASWNINSVRLRAQTVARFLKQWQPDVLTLQETKCPEGQFPASAFSDIGYNHIAERGQSGYHGVAIISRLPFSDRHSRQFCAKDDARHVSIKLDMEKPLTVHSFYVPAGGDVPDPKVNEKFQHKMSFLDEMESWLTADQVKSTGPSVLTGDLNIAPHENDVWSHKQLLKVVSHTPMEMEKLEAVRQAGNWQDTLRHFASEDEKLYSWWSYRSRDWQKSNRGRRLDHIWLDQRLAPTCKNTQIISETRSWEKPSDHVPVMVTLDL
jgi:exodeoxyribonuclease-3